MQIMGENHRAFFERYAENVGHIQVAEAPGRHQPGTGRIDVVSILNAIGVSGYKGWLGAGYGPSVATLESLDWFGNFRRIPS